MTFVVLLRLNRKATRMGNQMGSVTSAHSMSLDGFIADAEYRGDRLQTWLQTGETPSRLNPAFKMAPESARFFDEGVGPAVLSSPGGAPTTCPMPGVEMAQWVPCRSL